MESRFKNKGPAAAQGLIKRHGLDYSTAFCITDAIWQESRRSLKRLISAWGEDEWKRLGFTDKVEVCRILIRALLDKKRVASFLAGDRKTLV
ncbi:MAG: hypothetical protein HY880_05650 [Deltaproteobacteria bacterium]|nr:hypothetical protein [Deltaproteobacteria bacterium]